MTKHLLIELALLSLITLPLALPTKAEKLAEIDNQLAATLDQQAELIKQFETTKPNQLPQLRIELAELSQKQTALLMERQGGRCLDEKEIFFNPVNKTISITSQSGQSTKIVVQRKSIYAPVGKPVSVPMTISVCLIAMAWYLLRGAEGDGLTIGKFGNRASRFRAAYRSS